MNVKLKSAKSLVTCYLNATKQNNFCIELSQVIRNGFILKTQSKKSYVFNWQRLCSVSGRTRMVLCIMLSEPGETVYAQFCWQQIVNLNHILIEIRLELCRRHGKVILLHDKTPSLSAKPVEDALKLLGWDILLHPLYSPDLASSDYYVLRSMGTFASKAVLQLFQRSWKMTV